MRSRLIGPTRDDPRPGERPPLVVSGATAMRKRERHIGLQAAAHRCGDERAALDQQAAIAEWLDGDG